MDNARRSRTVRMRIRLLSLLLAALALFSLYVPALAADEPEPARLTDPASLDMTAPNAQARALVEKAMSYAGMTRAQAVAAGLPLYDGNWCASFVGLCAKAVGLGQVIPYNSAWPNERRMYQDVAAAGGERVTKPQVGDLVFFDFDGSTGFDLNSLKHIAIVCGIDRSTGEVYVVHGNTHNNEAGSYTRSVVCAVGDDCPYCRKNNWSLRYMYNDPQIAAYLRPDWSGTHVKNGLIMEDNRWFYYENGVKRTGHVKTADGVHRYFALDDGHMRSGGWITENGKNRYYADKDGTLYTGFCDIGTKSYYFSMNDAHLMRGGLVTGPGNKQYYVSAKDGHAMKGGWAQGPNHMWYYLDRTGVVIAKVKQNSRPTYTPKG